MNFKNDNTVEVINFLKTNYQEYEDELFEVIESSENGFCFINDQSITFSKQAKKILQVGDEISLDFFYQQINLHDRKKLLHLLSVKQNELTPYEVIYRYQLDNEQMIWIKEHGIFSFKNRNNRLAVISNYSNNIAENEQLHRLAYYDKLTQLKNRNFFEKDIDFLINYKIPFALFLMDLNSFKIINDKFGHLFGDYILKQFATRIEEKLMDNYDFDLYRLSGDEFAIIFPYVSIKIDTDKVVQLIFESLNLPFMVEDFKINITPSIGITFYPKDSNKLSSLLKFADISMYRAKNDPFIDYSYFDKNFYKELTEEKAIESYIIEIIKDDLITLRYQPIYNTTNNKIVSLEALFDNQDYPIEKIFNVALKTNLIFLLEKNIIEKVISVISKGLVPEDIRITINITPKTTEYIDVYTEIKQMLTKYNVNGKRIGIEITEQYFVNDEAKLNDLISKLQSLGIKIYLDDFGMGYSSVRNLTYLTYDNIKLDKRIISTVFSNQKCEFFIKTMFQFSKDINCDIIVEGVETKAQYDYLTSIGSCFIQGFYLSKPLNIENVLTLLK